MPVTVTVNATAPPGVVETTCGATVTAMIGAVTVIVAVSFFEVSATLVATTWYVPGVPGAV